MTRKIYLVMLYKPSELKIPPFPLMYLSFSLKKKGYGAKVVHCSHSEIDKYVQEIVKEEPLFVGFSVLSGPPTSFSLEMSKKIKEINNRIPIVWGGVHPSLMPEQCLEEGSIDIVTIGEGEEIIVEIAEALAENKPLRHIRGVGYKKDGKICINKLRHFIENLDDHKLDFECINLSDYVSERVEAGKKVRSIGYYSSRGCPHNCGFCYNQQYHRRKWRAQSSKEVIKDILFFKKKYSLNEVQLWDDNFFTDPKRAFEILKKIDMMVGADVRVDYINEEFAKKLKESKISYLLIGAESGNNRVLNLIKKNFNIKKILTAASLLNKYDLYAQYSFILGLPTETKDEFNDTIQLMLKLKNIHKKASFTVGMYLPYPGTEMFELALNQGFNLPTNTNDWYLVDRWANTVNLPWINNRLCLNVRHLFALLNWRFPIGLWSRIRLRHGWFKLSQDLRLIILLNTLKQRCLKWI